MAEHIETLARVHDEALRRVYVCASRWSAARGVSDSSEDGSVGEQMLDHEPAPDLAMRTAFDLDGRHAPHEGLRVLARERVHGGHGQQLSSQRESVGLRCRCEQAVVPDAFEPRWQHMLQQPADELLADQRDGALAAVVGTNAQTCR